jgi:hypothetical protein
MPKPYTLPTLYDEVKTIDISFLKKHGYLKPNQTRSGTLKWSINGEKTGSISIIVFNLDDETYLQLDYKCDGVSINYKVEIVSVPSNLGKGEIQYFLCPQTFKNCRKLYLVQTYFYHRDAFKYSMYECQTKSKRLRSWNNVLGSYFKQDQYYEQLYKKNFKKYYAGKPTKRYLHLLKQIKKAESIDSRDVEMLMML